MFLNYLFKLAMVLVLLAVVVLSGCMVSPAAPPAENDPALADQAATQAELEAQVREAIWAWEDAYQAGDLDRLMDIYADDAISMGPGRPMLEGKAEITEDFRLFFEEFTIDRQFSLVDLEILGDTAIRRGEWTETFSPKAGGDSITQVGRCLVVFKRIGDEWKMVSDIWNTESVTEGESAVAEETVSQADAKGQIEAAVWAYEDAYQAGDVDRLMTLYADDVVSLPPGFPKTEGKADLEAGFQEFFDTFTLDRDFELVSVEVSGDKATRLGEWTQTLTPKDGGEPIVETGRCILGYEKVGDEWQVAWEIWNTY